MSREEESIGGREVIISMNELKEVVKGGSIEREIG